MELVKYQITDTDTGDKLMNHSINYSGFIDLINEYSKEEKQHHEQFKEREQAMETNVELEQACNPQTEA